VQKYSTLPQPVSAYWCHHLLILFFRCMVDPMLLADSMPDSIPQVVNSSQADGGGTIRAYRWCLG
jgi:hypothetical protein